MKPMTTWLLLLATASASLLSGCAGPRPEIKDTTIWSYVGDIDGIAAIGAHTLSSKKEYMNVDQWVEFLASPAICLSTRDYAKQKTTLEQACMYAKCTEEEKKIITSITKRIDRHLARVKTTLQYQRLE